MSDSSVAVDVDEALDIHRNLFPKVSLNLVATLDHVSDSSHLHFREGMGPDVLSHLGLGQNFPRRASSDTENRCEGDVDPLVAGKVNTLDACHGLPLPLLVFGVFTQNANHTPPSNDAALVADPLDGCLNFHFHSSPAVAGSSEGLLDKDNRLF